MFVFAQILKALNTSDDFVGFILFRANQPLLEVCNSFRDFHFTPFYQCILIPGFATLSEIILTLPTINPWLFNKFSILSLSTLLSGKITEIDLRLLCEADIIHSSIDSMM